MCEPTTATAIYTAIAGAGTTALVSQLTKPSTPGTPAPPKVPEPTLMPTPDDAAVQEAKKKSIAAQLSGRGRAGTILTDAGQQKLGD